MERKIEQVLAENGVELHVFDDLSETERTFLAWFDRKVLGLDSEEYRHAFWREAFQTGHTIGRLPRTTWADFARAHGAAPREVPGLILLVGLLACATYGFWIVGRLASIGLARAKRRAAYGRERARRRAPAAERRAIQVRRTVNAKPTLAEIRAAYARARESPLAGLRLGALLEDLECYVDNHARRDDSGRVRGRAGGIKRLLEREAPDLFRHYTHVMSYKARAKRYRQACGAADPVPVDALLPVGASASDTPRFPSHPAFASAEALVRWMDAHGNTAFLRSQTWLVRKERAYTAADLPQEEHRAAAAEILAFGDGTLLALDAAIALRLDPGCVPETLPDGATVRVFPSGGRRLRVGRRVLDWIRRFRAASSRTAG